MNKIRVSFILIFYHLISFCQTNITPTSEFVISGLIKQEVKFSLKELEKFESKKIKNVTITAHNGEIKGSAKNMSGIPIKTLLSAIEIAESKPKLLSEFYFTFIASDGYKVVYSWNEIFNSASEETVFLITEKDGKLLNDIDDGILIITPNDHQTGRRMIKGLSKIVVNRTN